MALHVVVRGDEGAMPSVPVLSELAPDAFRTERARTLYARLETQLAVAHAEIEKARERLLEAGASEAELEAITMCVRSTASALEALRPERLGWSVREEGERDLAAVLDDRCAIVRLQIDGGSPSEVLADVERIRVLAGALREAGNEVKSAAAKVQRLTEHLGGWRAERDALADDDVRARVLDGSIREQGARIDRALQGLAAAHGTTMRAVDVFLSPAAETGIGEQGRLFEAALGEERRVYYVARNPDALARHKAAERAVLAKKRTRWRLSAVAAAFLLAPVGALLVHRFGPLASYKRARLEHPYVVRRLSPEQRARIDAATTVDEAQTAYRQGFAKSVPEWRFWRDLPEHHGEWITYTPRPHGRVRVALTEHAHDEIERTFGPAASAKLVFRGMHMASTLGDFPLEGRADDLCPMMGGGSIVIGLLVPVPKGLKESVVHEYVYPNGEDAERRDAACRQAQEVAWAEAAVRTEPEIVHVLTYPLFERYPEEDGPGADDGAPATR